MVLRGVQPSTPSLCVWLYKPNEAKSLKEVSRVSQMGVGRTVARMEVEIVETPHLWKSDKSYIHSQR